MNTFEKLAYKIENTADTKYPQLIAKGKEIDLLIKHESWGTAEGQSEQFIYLLRRLPNQDQIENVLIKNLLNSFTR